MSKYHNGDRGALVVERVSLGSRGQHFGAVFDLSRDCQFQMSGSNYMEPAPSSRLAWILIPGKSGNEVMRRGTYVHMHIYRCIEHT